jgi:hyperosmotically inducible periplasmic protein
MKIRLLACLFVAAMGCRDGGTESQQQSATDQAADNTKRNERDRDRGSVTPMDQGENERDIKISQQIRRGVLEQDDLSNAAKNVKVITADGVVTLRGPVDSAQEKNDVAQLARKVDGVKKVDNQLEIAAK